MVFVFYLDACNTALWKVFFLSVWLASLLICYWTGIKLLGSRGEERNLRESGITGSTYEKLRPNVTKRLKDFLSSAAASMAVISFYVWYYRIDRCTPESIFWTA